MPSARDARKVTFGLVYRLLSHTTRNFGVMKIVKTGFCVLPGVTSGWSASWNE